MIALCAAATALLLAGLLAGGALGTVLTVFALLGNLGWLTVTFVRWWQRASDRARLIVFAATVAYLAAWFVIRVAAGPLAAWALGLGFVGYVATVTGALMTTGYLAASHAKQTQAAIVAGTIKEINR